MTTTYLQTVKEKENRSWTLPEMAKIYTMRTKNDEPVEDVAKKFKATRIQIYNVTRMMKKQIQDLCYRCGNQLTDVEKMSRHPGQVFHLCTGCKKETLDYKKELREERIKKHLCGYCGKKKLPYPGAKACMKCLSSTYRRNLKKGLCGHCGEHPHRPGSSLCKTCADTMKAKASLKRVSI